VDGGVVDGWKGSKIEHNYLYTKKGLGMIMGVKMAEYG